MMEQVKIMLTVPPKHTKKILEVIGEAGGGIIGNYSHCSFSTKGIGRFKPNDKANPFIGKKGKLESVKEDKIEFVCLRKDAKRIIKKIKEVHPYEEVALDIFPLIGEDEL